MENRDDENDIRNQGADIEQDINEEQLGVQNQLPGADGLGQHIPNPPPLNQGGNEGHAPANLDEGGEGEGP